MCEPCFLHLPAPFELGSRGEGHCHPGDQGGEAGAVLPWTGRKATGTVALLGTAPRRGPSRGHVHGALSPPGWNAVRASCFKMQVRHEHINVYLDVSYHEHVKCDTLK